jgi:lambda family phage tail tape measure protein
LFGAGIKDPKGLGTPFLMARDALEALRKKQEESAAASKKLKEETEKAGKAAKDTGKEIGRIVDTSAYDNAVKGIKKVSEGYKENGRRILENIELEKLSIGNSREANDLEAARTALSNRAYDAVQQLREAQAAMSKELKEAGLGAVYDQEIAKVQELSRIESERLTVLITGLAKAKAAEELRLFGIKQQYDVEDKLLGIQREMADLTLTDIEKKYRDIARAADDSAKAAVRAEEARRGAPLNTQEIEAYYKKSREGIDAVVTAQKKLNAESRTFSTGWNKAWADFTDNATNAAQSAARVFEKFTSGIEDALVDFAKTGKLNWKSFVAGMAEELLRSQIKQTLASVLQIQNPFSSGGSSIGDSLGGLFGGLLGGTGGATRGQSANSPMYVLDVSGGGAGGALGGIMGPQQSGASGGGILGSIGNIFSGVKDAVGGVFGGIGNAIGGVVDSIGSIFSGGGSSGGGFLDSIGSTIGDLFGGFFANGGNIPAGKFGMVGERGPEFISGPASITPMSGSSNVTYNINAVDARSFQQLLASDPSFIYALTEQGRKSFAGAR